MSMTDLLQDVVTAIDKEYDRAAEKWGTTNNSDHESYAVLLEELEEATEELGLLTGDVSLFWSCIRKNSTEGTKLFHLRAAATHARLLIAECIQVAAMIEKARETIVQREEGEESVE